MTYLARFLMALSAVTWAAPVTAQPPCVAPIVIQGWSGFQTIGKPPVALDERVWHMRFSPDGTNLYTVTDRLHVVDWRKKLPQVIWQPAENETLMRAYFSPDCSLVARLNNGEKVVIHESATGKVLHTFERVDRSLAFAWAADSDLIAFAGNNQALICHARSGEIVRQIQQGESAIIALAFSPDGKLLIVANASADDKDRGIFLHHLDGSTPPVPLPGSAERSSECKLSFSPDSKTLAVCCNIGRREILYFWDVPEGRVISQQRGNYNSISHSPGGDLLAACGLNNIQVFETESGKEVFHHQGESINEHVWSIAFSPNGHTLAAGIENRIKVWDVRDWSEIDPDPDLKTPVSALAFTSDGRRLVTGSLNGDLILWDWQTKTPVWKHPAAPNDWHIGGVTIDPQDTLIAVNQIPRVYDEPHLRIVDLATGESRQSLPLPLPSSPFDAGFVFRSDRKTALIGNHHTIHEWDVPANKLIRSIPVPFLDIADSSPSFTIATLEEDVNDPDLIWWATRNHFGAIRLTDLSESCNFNGNHPPRDTDPIPPRSHRFINMGNRIWNLPTLHEVRSQGENDDPAFSYPFGNLLFIGWRSKVLVFDVLSQSVIHEFDFGYGEVEAVTLTPDGKTLVAATTSGLHYRELAANPMAGAVSSEMLWQIMGSDDHWQAYLAAWALARQPDFIPYLTAHLTPSAEITPGQLQWLNSLLSDGNHEVRQTAARSLLDLGLPLAKDTYETLSKGGLPSQLPRKNPFSFSNTVPSPPIPILIPLSEHRRAMRAVMILQEDASPAALEHLKLLASGRPDAPITLASRNALKVHAAK